MYLLVLKIEGGKKGRPIFFRKTDIRIFTNGDIGGANDDTPGNSMAI